MLLKVAYNERDCNVIIMFTFQSLRDPDGNQYHPYEYSLQQSVDGNILLVRRNQTNPHHSRQSSMEPKTKPDPEHKEWNCQRIMYQRDWLSENLGHSLTGHARLERSGSEYGAGESVERILKYTSIHLRIHTRNRHAIFANICAATGWEKESYQTYHA